MKLSALALGFALAVLWGVAMCFFGVMHAIQPSYGGEFLRVIGSIYPGISGSGTFADTVIATVYGVVDGFVGGFLIATVYNFFASKVAGRR